MVKRALLCFPCRHHVYELYSKAAFECIIPNCARPNITLFQRFFLKKSQEINQTNFKCFTFDDDIDVFANDHAEILNFIEKLLNRFRQPRDDYEEFLVLAMVIFGETKNVNFSALGAYNQRRWMAKAIHTLKTYLFREQFDMPPEEEASLKDVCIFIVKLYIQA